MTKQKSLQASVVTISTCGPHFSPLALLSSFGQCSWFGNLFHFKASAQSFGCRSGAVELKAGDCQQLPCRPVWLGQTAAHLSPRIPTEQAARANARELIPGAGKALASHCAEERNAAVRKASIKRTDSSAQSTDPVSLLARAHATGRSRPATDRTGGTGAESLAVAGGQAVNEQHMQ